MQILVVVVDVAVAVVDVTHGPLWNFHSTKD